MSVDLPVQYDGTVPFPASDVPPQVPAQRATQLTAMTLIVAAPFAGLVAALWLLWGHGVSFAYLGLAAFFYLLTGFGVTAGFHRCLTHRGFTAVFERAGWATAVHWLTAARLEQHRRSAGGAAGRETTSRIPAPAVAAAPAEDH
jgi:hypothetical protein